MSLVLNEDYAEQLRSQKPELLKQHSIRPPGAKQAIVVPEQTIPPVNTDIRFSLLPEFKLSEHRGLAAIPATSIPERFNWRDDGGEKSKWIAEPGNQLLCGSCWCTSIAGAIADNFVVSNKVTWKPNLSTTWCLACYPQNRCKGGNPAILLENIAANGIATESCIDYSWCSTNEKCNGKATQHFEGGGEGVDLSSLVPSCGCYYGGDDREHFLYFIDKNPKQISIGKEGITAENIALTVKKHVYTHGPVIGGFLVFKNFRTGLFAKVNGGVYLENSVIGANGVVTFDPKQTSAENYIGSHAIAIIGWGIEKGVVVDNDGTKKDVPYWFCRNSWTDKWADRGCFKMAMYPFNKVSQFEQQVVISTPKGRFLGGGMAMITVSQPPKKTTLKEVSETFRKATQRAKPDSFYETEYIDTAGNQGSGKSGGKSGGGSGDQGKNKGGSGVVKKIVDAVVPGSTNWQRIAKIVAIILGSVLLLYLLWRFFIHRNQAATSSVAITQYPWQLPPLQLPPLRQPVIGAMQRLPQWKPPVAPRIPYQSTTPSSSIPRYVRQ